MKKYIYLAVFDGISDWEYGYVLAHINSPEFQQKPDSYKIKTVGRTLNPIKSKGGVTILPDISINQVIPTESAMLILCGSDKAAAGGIDDFVLLGKRFIEHGICVAAICGATAALAKYGLLDSVKHTSNAKAFLQMTGYTGISHYIEKPAVTDQNIITASGIEPVAFAIEIFKKLELYSEDTLNAWIKLFEQRNIAGFYELMEANVNE